jgi:alpha-ribazole phosphatase
MRPMRLILVRHGETDWNAAKRFQGQADIPLNRTGQRQAAAVARMLRHDTVQAIISSDLRRAQETARVIAAPLQLTINPDSRWREMAFGDWEGLTYDVLQHRHPKRLVAWYDDPLQMAPPNGETLIHVANRVRTAWHDLRATYANQTVVLVAHGGPLRILLCLALGLPPDAHWQFAVDPAALSELLVYGQDATLIRLNDTAHLRAAMNPSPQASEGKEVSP